MKKAIYIFGNAAITVLLPNLFYINKRIPCSANYFFLFSIILVVRVFFK